MLAQADHNNMGSLSKQHERNKMADSAVNFQRSEKRKFQKKSGGAWSLEMGEPPRNVWRLRHKKHRTLAPGAISSKHLTL